MLTLLSNVKNKLSHVKETTWHYKAVKSVWGWNTGGKACTYYWFKLPSSFVVLGALMVLGAIITVISWFFGQTPTWIKPTDPELEYYHKSSSYLFYPHGATSKGKRRHILPWWFGAAGGVILGIYYLAVMQPAIGLIVAVVALAVLILGGAIYLLANNWDSPGLTNARANLKAAWDKACPPLEVVEEEQSASVSSEAV